MFFLSNSANIFTLNKENVLFMELGGGGYVLTLEEKKSSSWNRANVLLLEKFYLLNINRENVLILVLFRANVLSLENGECHYPVTALCIVLMLARRKGRGEILYNRRHR